MSHGCGGGAGGAERQAGADSDDSQAAAANSKGAQAGRWGDDLPGELADPLAEAAPRGGMGLPCPPLGTGCAEAYLCELSSEPLPQLCRAAVGNRASGCYAAADAVWGPKDCCECGGILGAVRT